MRLPVPVFLQTPGASDMKMLNNPLQIPAGARVGLVGVMLGVNPGSSRDLGYVVVDEKLFIE